MGMTPLPGLILATRTDTNPDHLHAFLSHHLQVCEHAVVLVDHRPGESPSSALNQCLRFGGRVTAIAREDAQFHNGRTCSALQDAVKKHGGSVVLHLDKDEYCKNLHDIEGIYRRILSGESDYAEGRMICRFAVGGRLHEDWLESFADYCAAAPVRSHVLGQYGFPDVKCYLTRFPHICLHHGDRRWKKDPQGMPLEHFRWGIKCMEKALAKISQHPGGIKNSILHRERNVTGRTGDFLNKLDKGFRPNAWGIAGWMDYGDVYRAIAKALPEDGLFCEVGVFKGRSLTYMGEYLALLGKPAKAIGYDWFNPDWTAWSGKRPMIGGDSDDWMGIVRGNLEAFCPWNTPEIRRASSWDSAAHHEDASVDAVWIDAGHDTESVRRDVEAWMPKIKDGGIMAGHDIDLQGVRNGLKCLGVEWRKVSKRSWVAIGGKFHDPMP
jgi:hypothetical protein